MDTQYDVAVLGGGPAGLQAALTLGRMHHRVLLLDSGHYRNDPADAMHNLIAHDGWKPWEFRSAARDDLAAYATVEVRDVPARQLTSAIDGSAVFAVRTDDGVVTARRVVLATGLSDTLPATPGLAELFGSVAAHCPYCHGYEYAGTHVGILGAGPHVVRVALLLRRIASRITVFADGGELDPATLPVLTSQGVQVRPEPVTGVCRSALGAKVSFATGDDEEVGGLMVAPTQAQAAPFAEQLGLELNPSGCIRVDGFGRTSLDGVYAAGDAAHVAELPMPLASVGFAVAAGQLAATAIDLDEITGLTMSSFE